MAEPTDATLQQRCAEVVEWQRTGVLPGNALRNYAEAHWAGLHDALQMAERDTSAQAMQWIAKWGTSPAEAGEPEGWITWWPTAPGVHKPVYSHGPNKPSHGPALDSRLRKYPVFTPQPTQAQAGAVPLPKSYQGSTLTSNSHDAGCRVSFSFSSVAEAEAWHESIVDQHHGIKGGQYVE